MEVILVVIKAFMQSKTKNKYFNNFSFHRRIRVDRGELHHHSSDGHYWQKEVTFANNITSFHRMVYAPARKYCWWTDSR